MKASEIIELRGLAETIVSSNVAIANLEAARADADTKYHEIADAVVLAMGFSPQTHRLNIDDPDDPKVEEIARDGFQE